MNELINSIYKLLRKNFYPFFENIKKYKIITSEEFRENMFANHFEYFEKNIQRYLVIDFQDNYSNTNRSEKSDKYLNEYIKNFVLTEHPLFLKNIKHKMELYHSLIIDILEKFRIDKPFINENNCIITDIKIDLGDSHNHGQTVAIVYTNKKRILDKPKDLTNDCFFYDCLAFINNHLNISYEYPNIMVCNNYSWQSFVHQKKCQNISDLQNYYYSLGTQAFLLYLLNANDMHFENLIASGNSPIFIDLETILQTVIDSPKLNYTNSYASVLDTLLFDFSDYESTMEKIGGTTNRKNMPVYNVSVVNANNDNISIVESVNNLKNSSDNIPRNKCNESVEIYEMKNEFFAGFKDSYKLIIDNKKKILKTLNKYKSFDIRMVLRPTTVYANFVEYFKQVRGEDETQILNILENSINTYKKNKEIASYELNCLKNWDIPLFKVNLNSTNLVSVDGELKIDNFFKLNPKENLIKKINCLNLNDLDRQCFTLDLAIDAYRENQDEKEDYKCKKRNDTVSINTEIEKILNYTTNNNSIYNIQLDINGKTSITPITYDIYYGLGGIAILFAQYYHKTKIATYKKEVMNLKTKIHSMWINDKSLNFSAFHGRFSYFKFIYILNEHFNYGFEFETELYELLEEYLHYLNNTSNYSIDYLGGISGVISLLSDIYTNLIPHRFLFEFIKKLISFLFSKSYKLNDHCFHWKSDIQNNNMTFGLAHGIDGVFLSLYKANLILSDFKIDQSIKTYLLTNNYDSNSKNTVTWCNGLSGIILVLNIIGKDHRYSNNIELSDICETLIQNYYKFPIENSSICHGIHGNSLIFKFLKLPNINTNNSDYEWPSGFLFPNENIGFFLGKAGQLFDDISDSSDSSLIQSILT